MQQFLVVILVILGVWIIYMSAGFFLVWGPPMFAALVLSAIPSIQTRIAAIYFRKKGTGAWITQREQIEAVLKTPGFRLLIGICSTALLVLWIAINGYPALSLGETFGNKTLQGYFVGQTDGARWARLFFTAVPWVPIMIGVLRLTRFFVVRRIEKIAARLAGTDPKTEALRQLDSEITSCFQELGSRRRSLYADDFQTWRASHIDQVIRNSALYKREFDQKRSSAEAELKSLTRCASRFNEVKSAYQSGLARLRRATSVALLASLEDAGRTLLSDAFVQLVETGRWQDIETFLQEVKAELARIETMTDEWTNSRGETSSAPTKEMTFDKAVRLLALPKSFTREDIDRRRKEMAKIYHPDRAAGDDDLRQRNQEAMKEINEACDMLLRSV